MLVPTLAADTQFDSIRIFIGFYTVFQPSLLVFMGDQTSENVCENPAIN